MVTGNIKTKELIFYLEQRSNISLYTTRMGVRQKKHFSCCFQNIYMYSYEGKNIARYE